MKDIEDIQTPVHNYASWRERCRLHLLKRKLKSGYKAASSRKNPMCHWEDALILTGGVVSKISGAPGLAPLKALGDVLNEIGEQVKVRTGKFPVICRTDSLLLRLNVATKRSMDSYSVSPLRFWKS